jgi:SAM-dependent methyltransferase
MVDTHIRKTIATYDAIADDYTRKTDSYAPLQEREKFLSLLPSTGRILDVGCGPGRDSTFFVSRGFSVVGIDLSEKLLSIAKERAPNATFQKQDLRKLSFPKETFNGIWANASLLHIKRFEVSGVLKRSYEVLKPGCILFILVKKGKGEGYVRYKLAQSKPRYFTYFETNELRDLLAGTGFVILDSYTWDQKDRWPERPSEIWISSFAKAIRKK